jgi:hypothetical protein
LSDAAIADDWQLSCDIGLEHSPTNPWGKTVLVVAGDGALSLDQRMSGGYRSAWSGRIDEELVRALRDHLAAARFPSGGQRVYAPDASIVRLELRERGARRSVELDYYTAEETPGYRELLGALEAIATQLSGGRIRRGVLELPPVVRDIQRIHSTP